MNKRTSALALLLACMMSACNPGTDTANKATPAPTSAASPTPSDVLTPERIAEIRTQVTAAQERSTKALLDGDANAINDTFSAGFSTAGGNYQIESRDALARGIQGGKTKFESITTEISDVKVPTANTALVTGKRTVRGTVNGESQNYTYDLKGVYVLEQGKWKALLWSVVNPC